MQIISSVGLYSSLEALNHQKTCLMSRMGVFCFSFCLFFICVFVCFFALFCCCCFSPSWIVVRFGGQVQSLLEYGVSTQVSKDSTFPASKTLQCFREEFLIIEGTAACHCGHLPLSKNTFYLSGLRNSLHKALLSLSSVLNIHFCAEFPRA